MQKYIALFIIHITYFIRDFIRRLSNKFTPANLVLLEMVRKFTLSKAIGTAAELKIADYLKSGPKDIHTLATEINTDESALYRLMRFLAGNGVFREKKNRIFALSRLSYPLCEGNNSMRHMIMHQLNQINWQITSELKLAVESGKFVTEKVLGEELFAHLEKNPEKNELYNKAMTNSTEFLSKVLVKYYKLPSFKTIVDVGGGEGVLLSYFLKTNKKGKGILFDFPHVVANAESYFKRMGVDNRASIVAGNFLEEIPVHADTYLLKNIFHAFDDKTCKTILGNIKKVMTKDGKILIVEMDMKKRNKPSMGKSFDIQMLVGVKGGRERTIDDFKKLFGNSGFKFEKVIKTITPFHIIIASQVIAG